ncbi:MAG: AAA family ATPase, partial [Nitrososphaera sp.]|nr:AAA family ATPase [Nitrososphaera sp.]
VADLLKDRLPKFLYFTEYYKLYGLVSINELISRQQSSNVEFGHRIFLALLNLANSSPETITQTARLEQLIMELEAISAGLTDEIFTFWSQNSHLDVKFQFDMARPGDPAPFNDGYVFSTRIYNRRHRATVNFDERSTGFVWFFSFLVWFSQAKRNYGDNLIILLDEPGLSLHGTAQHDLLRYINKRLRPDHQVIYTTHSPFMIDVENIFSVRTVEDVVAIERMGDKDVEKVLGTKVGQRILSRDPDTLLPLQGIVGFDIAQAMFVGPYVFIVEGPAEAAYINWFSRRLVALGREGLDLRWAVAPAEGASKVTSFATLFAGRGLKIATLLDYHEGQKSMVDHLEQSGLLTEGHLLKTTNYAQQDDADIEDVVGRSTLIHLVNGGLNLTGSYALPDNKPPTAPRRVVKEVEDYCRTLPPGFPEFDHYKPVQHLLQLNSEKIEIIPGMAEALDRFEKLFHDLNGLI